MKPMLAELHEPLALLRRVCHADPALQFPFWFKCPSNNSKCNHTRAEGFKMLTKLFRSLKII